MNRLMGEQLQRNEATRDNWELSRSHRDRVTRLLLPECRSGNNRLCVLGAGNCNDLDIAKLAARFREIHLVDLDSNALHAGVARQAMPWSCTVVLHGNTDVTGVYDLLARFLPENPASASEIDRLLSAVRSHQTLEDLGRFETVLSACLLSQLHEAVVRTVGEKHPRFPEVLLSLRQSHLDLLARLTRPEGRGLLVWDFTSSDSLEELRSVAESDLVELLANALDAGNFFHGLNPFVLASLFKRDSAIAPCVTDVRLADPWRWDFGPRVYAVSALSFQRL